MWETIPWLVVLAISCGWLGWRDHQRKDRVDDARRKAEEQVRQARDHYFSLEQDLITRREKAFTRLHTEYAEKVERLATHADTGELVEKLGRAVREIVNPAVDTPDYKATSPDTVGLDSNFHDNGKPTPYIPPTEFDDWMQDGKEDGPWQETTDQLPIPPT